MYHIKVLLQLLPEKLYIGHDFETEGGKGVISKT